LDIGRGAGGTHGTFYNYFSSKDEVFTSLVQELIDRLVTAATEVEEERSVRRRLEIALGAMLVESLPFKDVDNLTITIVSPLIGHLVF
jgi:AcrR family transcriptional regulator